MMQMNRLRIENAEISKTIHLQHKNNSLKFSLLGYSVYSSIGEGHFFSYLLIGEEWYIYGGIRRPRMCKENQPLIRSNETLTTIVYYQ